MPTIAVQTSPPGLLAAVAPLGLAGAHETVLVIDLDPSGVSLPGRRTLRDLVEASPTAADLRPRRRGTACLPNGNIDPDSAKDVVEALVAGWPATVVRVPEESGGLGAPGVGVRAVLPGVRPPVAFLPVFQPTGIAPVPPGLGGLLLPRLTGRVAKALLAGVAIRNRWTRAWSEVWDRAIEMTP